MEHDSKQKTVVVIGGGITGLSAAYYLNKGAQEQGVDLRIVLIEADDKLGGKIQTETYEGFVMERGPDSFLARKPAGVNLARELGIDDEFVGTNPHARKTYILHKGKLRRIPQGLNIGVPTQFVPFATTSLLSWGGKLRASLDLVMGRTPNKGDQSLGAFLEKRLGKEVVDHMAEPLLAGIYAGDLRKLSLRSTFPQFEQLEQKYGSLVRGMMAQAKDAKAAQAAKDAQTKPELGANPAAGGQRPLPQSVFLTFRTGLQRLIDRLEAVLEGKAELRTSIAVRSIQPSEGGRYQVALDNGETIDADSVVVTTAAYDAATLLPESFTPKTQLQQVPYVSVATVLLGFEKATIDYPLDASGFLVPRKERRTITACTWTSSKWQHTARDGRTLLRFYVGRSGDEGIVDQPDDEIIRHVRKDFGDIMGVTAEPMFAKVQRWRRAMPQYTVGHLDRVQAFAEQAAAELPGVFFAGAGFTGLGIPDCIDQGLKTSNGVLSYLKR